MADARTTPETTVLPARREVEDLVARVREADQPVVSLYLDVHAGTDPAAPAQRADAALRTLPLERATRERLERRIHEVLRDVGEGTLAYVAAADPSELEEIRLLRVAPPIPGGAKEAAVRWGDAWTAPLQLLLASEAPIVAAFADERRARVFVLDLGEVSEAAAYVRALDPTGWRRYAEHSTGMPGTPARGGSGQDAFEDRKDAWTSRFVDDVAEQLSSAVAAREGARLVLLGESRRVRQLEEALSEPMKKVLLATGPAPADPDLGTTRWAEPLAEFVRDALHDEDERLLDRLAEQGVTGTGPTLDALQKGELALVAVPADVDVEIVRCLEADWLAEDDHAAGLVCPDGPIERAPLKDHLLTAAKRGRARLRVLRGPDAESLTERIGPLAGLPRRA